MKNQEKICFLDVETNKSYDILVYKCRKSMQKYEYN